MLSPPLYPQSVSCPCRRCDAGVLEATAELHPNIPMGNDHHLFESLKDPTLLVSPAAGAHGVRLPACVLPLRAVDHSSQSTHRYSWRMVETWGCEKLRGTHACLVLWVWLTLLKLSIRGAALEPRRVLCLSHEKNIEGCRGAAPKVLMSIPSEQTSYRRTREQRSCMALLAVGQVYWRTDRGSYVVYVSPLPFPVLKGWTRAWDHPLSRG